MEYLAILGRFNAGPTCTILAELMSTAHTRLASLASTPASGSKYELEVSVANEALWWLVSYAGYLMADEAMGEVVTVPPALNALSKQTPAGATGAGGLDAYPARDPVVNLSVRVLAVLQASVCIPPFIALCLNLGFSRARQAACWLPPLLPCHQQPRLPSRCPRCWRRSCCGSPAGGRACISCQTSTATAPPPWRCRCRRASATPARCPRPRPRPRRWG